MSCCRSDLLLFFSLSAVIPVKLLPTSRRHLQKNKRVSVFSAGPDVHRWTNKTRATEPRKRYKFLHNTHISFRSFHRKHAEFSRFRNSLRSVPPYGRGSLLLANNSSSCSEAVGPYEKIWENDAVCVYRDLVCRMNPIKMMKKPRLCTSWGWAACAALSHGGKGHRHREREVITVAGSTGNVASLWRLVMITAAGNNKTPVLRNYRLASLTLDTSNNAYYPHIPL